MNFDLTSEQQMLQDSVRRFIERDYQLPTRAALIRSRSSELSAHWGTMARNGWLAAAIPEAHGGFGGSSVDTALIAHELGRGLVVEPYLGVAVLAAQALVAADTDGRFSDRIAGIAEGSAMLGLAYSERELRGLSGPFLTRASQEGDAYILNGSKTLVLGGETAASYLVAVRSEQGPALFLVEGDQPGLTRVTLPLQDGSLAAELTLDNVRVGADALVCTGDRATQALQHALSHGIAALCAELVGVMERAIEITIDYVRVRKQFGATIGQFQAVQHRIADMSGEMEYARSMMFALLASMHGQPNVSSTRMLASAKASICRCAKSVCAQAIQLHGGIGMTDEYPVGHYYQRAVVADRLLGGSDMHEAVAGASLHAELASWALTASETR